MTTEEQLLQAMNWRYAVKHYDSNRRIDDNTLNILLESLRLTPSSLGMQPWRFLVISNTELRNRLKEAGFNQPQWTEASHIILFAAQNKIDNDDAEKYLNSIVTMRGVERSTLNGLAENIFNYIKVIKLSEFWGHTIMKRFSGMCATDWAEKQCYIALGNLLTSAAIINVDASPMEGFSPKKFDDILGLTDYHTVVACALGYRDQANDFLANSKKVRYPLDEVVKFYR